MLNLVFVKFVVVVFQLVVSGHWDNEQYALEIEGSYRSTSGSGLSIREFDVINSDAYIVNPASPGKFFFLWRRRL